jgi:hypothetical protein
MAAHKDWRLSIAGNAGGSDTSAVEIEYYDASGTYLTTGGTPTASSVIGGFPVSQLYDANFSTRWAGSGVGTPTTPMWIAYSFAGPVDVTVIRVGAYSGGGQAITPIKVQYSDNGGSTWNDATGYINVPWQIGNAPSLAIGTPLGGYYCNWRMRVVGITGGHASFLVAEILMKDMVGGGTLVPNTTYAIAGSPNNFQPPANAFDGVISTYAECNDGGFIGYSFKKLYKVIEVDWTIINNSTWNQGGPLQLYLEGSNDLGNTWTTVAHFVADPWTSPGQVQVFGIKPDQRDNIAYNQIRAAHRNGSATQFQMFGGGTTQPTNCVIWDGNANVIDAGNPPLTRIATAPPAHNSIGQPGQTAVDSAGDFFWCYAPNAWSQIGPGGFTSGGTATSYTTMVAGTTPSSPVAGSLSLFFNSANSNHLSRVDSTGAVVDIEGSGNVPNTRLINTTAPLTGGGNLTADRTLAVSLATSSAVGVMKPDGTTITVNGSGVITATGIGTGGGVPTTRLVSTTAPLTGGGDLSADRTLAVSLATTSAVGVVKADGTTITVDGTGKITAVGGGGGAPVTSLYVLGAADAALASAAVWPALYNDANIPPASPGSLNDEFDAAFSGWTLVGTTPTSAATNRSWLAIQAPSNPSTVDAVTLYVKTLLSGTNTYTARMRLVCGETNYCLCGLAMRDSGSGRFQAFWVGYSNGWKAAIENFSGPSTSVSFAYGGTLWRPSTGDIYVRVKDDTVNFTFSISADGANWLQLAQISRTAYLATPNQIGLYLEAVNGNPALLTVDYFRNT